MANLPSFHVVISRLGHPVRFLHEPPKALPHTNLEASMTAFAEAGRTACANPHTPLATLIHSAFADLAAKTDTSQWLPGWLGKGTLDVGAQPTAIALAGDVWSACFKTNFIPFWLHSESRNTRLSRVDPVQHAAIHDLSAATRLCKLLSQEDQLRIQRLAISTPTAGTMSMQEVAHLLGFHVDGCNEKNAFPRTAHDFIAAIGNQGAENAARFLHFARVVWVREQVFVVNLPEATVRRQAIAIMRRTLRHGEDGELPEALVASSNINIDTLVKSVYRWSSIKATHLCVCTECARVANAYVERGSGEKNGKLVAFNELGCTQSMVRWTTVLENMSNAQSDTKISCMHCAKRSSAALRSAMGFQQDMMKRKVEGDEVDSEAIVTLSNQARKRKSNAKESDGNSNNPHELEATDNAETGEAPLTGITARMRRDCKTAFDQRQESISCIESKMLTVGLIGKAVRIYGAWYTYCESCAAIVKLEHPHRYGTQICCLRCDATVLYSRGELEAVTDHTQASQAVSCRYCGAIDPQKSGIRWRKVKAPHDVAGANASLPVPLRTIFFCGRHYKSWIVSACKSLPTRTILAHLALGAKPVFQSMDKRKRNSEEGGSAEKEGNTEQAPLKRKQRKLPKAKHVVA